MLLRLFRPFLMWLFNALESRGLSSSKLHSNSPETDITAPQLSNSPQYSVTVSYKLYVEYADRLTFGAEKTVTRMRSVKNS